VYVKALYAGAILAFLLLFAISDISIYQFVTPIWRAIGFIIMTIFLAIGVFTVLWMSYYKHIQLVCG